MTTTTNVNINPGLAGVNHLALRNVIGTRVTSVTAPVFALEAGDKNDIQTTNAIDYMIDGIPQTQVTAISDENLTITSSDDGSTNQADATTCYYVLGLDSAGALKLYKGEDGVTAYLPRVPAAVCPVCVLKIVNASGATFTPGTEDYDASGITATFTDVVCLPAAVP